MGETCVGDGWQPLRPLARSGAGMSRVARSAACFNKLFSCTWIDDRTVLAGTKDNKLVRWTFGRNYTKVRPPPPATAPLHADLAAASFVAFQHLSVSAGPAARDHPPPGRRRPRPAGPGGRRGRRAGGTAHTLAEQVFRRGRDRMRVLRSELHPGAVHRMRHHPPACPSSPVGVGIFQSHRPGPPLCPAVHQGDGLSDDAAAAHPGGER